MAKGGFLSGLDCGGGAVGDETAGDDGRAKGDLRMGEGG